MTYDWYKIFNLDEFLELDLTSKTYELYLNGIGLKNVLVTQGNYTSILIDGDFLSLNMSEKNPFEFNDKAIYVNTDNDVFYGVPHAS